MRKFLFLLFIYLISDNSQADSLFIYSESEGQDFIGRYSSYLLDEKSELSINDIIKRNDFIPSRNGVPNFGSFNGSIWIKISLKNSSQSDKLILELSNPVIDKVNFYSPKGNNEYVEVSLGQYKSFTERKYKHVNYLFDLNILPGESKDYFLKITSLDPIVVPLKVQKLSDALYSVTIQNFLFGLYAGLMLIMVLYNLFIFLTVRDKSYLYYVIYIIAVALTQATFQGYTFMYLWPELPGLEIQSMCVVSIFVGFASVEFLRVFLNTKRIVPKLDRVFPVAYILYSISLIVTILGYYREAWNLINAIVTPLSIYMLVVAVIIVRKGYRPAVFFTVAWSIFLIGVFIYALKDFGILPYNYITKYTMPVGSAIETVLLSFALADRIKILQREKEESQLQVLRAMQENERITKEQNIILEQKVEERTLQLRQSNNELAKAIKDLKETQSQLVQSEKMASLGQLTAGIAHEINNPINFVSSSIKPLKRDIKDLISVLNEYDSLSLNNFQQKIIEIRNLQEKLDLVYVKEEIESLLKGIDEGAARTAEIVKGLRTFSRVDEMDLKRVDLHEGIDSTLILLSSMMRGKIVVDKNYGNIPLVECYAGKMNQVFMNILNNAIYAILKKNLKDGEGKISIRTIALDKNVSIYIKDNGIGMPQEVCSKIFDPFFTTKDVGEGTGLGLSIVYNIIENHKGRIEVESVLGEGTEFVITLPTLQSNS